MVAHDVHLECCQGKLDPAFAIATPVEFHHFREKLALQMLRCNPANQIYPGDDRSCAATKLAKKKRKRDHGGPSSGSSTASSILESDRICGDLGLLIDHISSIWKLPKNSRVCDVCGEPCHQVCGMCDTALHHFTTPEGLAAPCFFHHHDSGFCGLSRGDCKTMGTPKRDWKLATRPAIESNGKVMKNLSGSLNNSTPMTPNRLGGDNGNNDNGALNPNAI